MTANSFVHEAEQLLKEADLPNADLVEARPETEHGYADAIFRLGPLLLRFVLDRGQKFLDIGSAETPKKFYQFHDVECLMGWTTIERILDERVEPESLKPILTRLRTHLKALSEVFSRERHEATNTKLEKVRRMRGDLRQARNRQKAANRS